MRAATVALTAFALTCLTGAQCQWLRTDTKPPLPPGTPPLQEYQAASLVQYLNEQARSLRSLRYDKVSVSAQGPDGSFRLRDGILACSKPRNFRLIGDHLLQSGAFEAGSNDEEFWLVVRQPSPTLMYCSHEDFARGTVNLPIPFEPDWVLQALGMKDDYDPNIPYTANVDQKDRTYTLSWEAKSPQGQAIRKSIVVAGDLAYGTKPQVVRHVIADTSGTIVAKADIKRVEWVTVPTCPSGRVQVPTNVVLDWPLQKSTMDLTLGEVSANQQFTDQQMAYFFTRPKLNGVTPVNLATARFSPSSYRGQSPGEGYGLRPRTSGSR